MNIKYVSIPEIGLTKCILSDVEFDVDNYLLDHDKYWPIDHGPTMPKQFIGVAKLSPNDTWDETLGRRIAYNKARSKYDHSFFKCLQTFINERDKTTNTLVEEINALGKRFESSRNHREAIIEQSFSLPNDVTFTPEEQ